MDGGIEHKKDKCQESGLLFWALREKCEHMTQQRQNEKKGQLNKECVLNAAEVKKQTKGKDIRAFIRGWGKKKKMR